MPRKLFEVLAVEGNLKTQAQHTRTELNATFKSKRHLFEEKRTTYLANTEGAEPVVEEQKDIQTDVTKELVWITTLWSKAIDTSYEVAVGNTLAKANVELDNGVVLLHDVPATALLELEKRAGELVELLLSVPTLDPAKGFTPDPDRGKNIFKARETSRPRTKKVQQPVTLYPATTEHPAQTQLITVDMVTGDIKEQEWSGLVTPARKSELIERAEEVRRAFKAALHRANAVELGVPQPIATKMFAYVLDGALPGAAL